MAQPGFTKDSHVGGHVHDENECSECARHTRFGISRDFAADLPHT